MVIIYYYDTESKLYYLQQRYYDPQVRRFISPDSLNLLPMLAGYVGQLNLYAYCNNNPVMFTDSTGEFALSITAILLILGAFAVVGGALGGVVAARTDGNILAGVFLGAGIGLIVGGVILATGGAALAKAGIMTVTWGGKALAAAAAFKSTALLGFAAFNIGIYTLAFGSSLRGDEYAQDLWPSAILPNNEIFRSKNLNLLNRGRMSTNYSWLYRNTTNNNFWV